MKAFFAEHNFREPGSSFMMVAVGGTFLMGIVLVLLYAGLRTRFGPGVKTAIIAALFLWFGVYLYSGAVYAFLLGIPMSAMLIGFVWGLVEYALGAIVGAWLYKEA